MWMMMADAPKMLQFIQITLQMRCHCPIMKTHRHNIAEYGISYNTNNYYSGCIWYEFLNF